MTGVSNRSGRVVLVRQTNWCVITGAPCSGKTAVIYELKQGGYKVIHEVARAYIDEMLDDGQPLDQIKADVYHLNSLIEESYQLLGYDIVHVPVISIKKRADFILEQI